MIDKVVLEKKFESVPSPQIPNNKQATTTISKMVFGINFPSNMPMKEQKKMKSQIKKMNDYLRIDGEKWFDMVKTIVELTEERDDGIDAKNFLEAMTEGPLGMDLWLYHKTLQELNEENKSYEDADVFAYHFFRVRFDQDMKKKGLLDEDENLYCGKIGVKDGDLVYRSEKDAEDEAIKKARDEGLFVPIKKDDEKVDEKDDDEKDIDNKVEEAIGVEEKNKIDEWLSNIPNVECAKTMSDAIDDALKWRMLVEWVKKTGEDEDSNIWDFLGDELGLQADGTEKK